MVLPAWRREVWRITLRRTAFACLLALGLCSCGTYEANPDRTALGPFGDVTPIASVPLDPRPVSMSTARPSVQVVTGTDLTQPAPLTQPTSLEQFAPLVSGNAQPGSPTPTLLAKPAAPALAPMDPTWQKSSATYARPAKPAAQAVVPEETARILNRPGWLVRDASGSKWVFQFQRTANDAQPVTPMEVLPCAFLAAMEEVAVGQAPRQVTFRISGEVTQYRERDYLLIRSAVEELDSSATTQPVPPVQP